jgi:hypothetical protein
MIFFFWEYMTDLSFVRMMISRKTIGYDWKVTAKRVAVACSAGRILTTTVPRRKDYKQICAARCLLPQDFIAVHD